MVKLIKNIKTTALIFKKKKFKKFQKNFEKNFEKICLFRILTKNI
jgi:hypothetical protein